MAKVLVVMGSDSDYPVVKDCLKVLRDFGVKFDAEVCSAHRTPERAADISKHAKKASLLKNSEVFVFYL